MKKNYLQFIGSFLLSLFVGTSCQKEMNDKKIDTANVENTTAGENNKDGCPLVYFNWENSATWTFHYNKKGLADKWVIDYGDGFPEVETMIYNRCNKLIKAHESYQGVNYVIDFTYTGNRVTQVSWTTVGSPDPPDVIMLTYNHKGQMVRQDDNTEDSHTLMYYDDMGNTTRTDIYFGTDLWFSDIYTFKKPVRNALMKVPGIDFGFPFYGTGNFTNKRWFSSNTGITYDNGTPTVLYDYDPSKTSFKTDGLDFPLYVTYYDKIAEAKAHNTLKYSCACGDGIADEVFPQSNSNALTDKHAMHIGPMPLLRGSVQSIKEQIQALKNHSLK